MIFYYSYNPLSRVPKEGSGCESLGTRICCEISNMWAYISSKHLCIYSIVFSWVVFLGFLAMHPNHFFFLYTLVKKSKHRLPLRYASLWRRGRKFCSSYFFVFKILEWKLPLEVECIIYHTCDFIGRCKKGWELGSRLLKDFGGALDLFLCICLKVLFKVYLAFHS